MSAIARLIVALSLMGEGLLLFEHLDKPKVAIAYGFLLAATLLAFVFLVSHGQEPGPPSPPRRTGPPYRPRGRRSRRHL
ncbi:MAG TPA: hypothetical protein VG125_13115 [Pirellulales bacterium]|jgi:hypothetical protein|nr:hypothetical protein [Pirellulales bacterium]